MQKPCNPRPDTPCAAVCATAFDEVCRGCGRTADEVARRVALTGQEKDAVRERIAAHGHPRRQS